MPVINTGGSCPDSLLLPLILILFLLVIALVYALTHRSARRLALLAMLIIANGILMLGIVWSLRPDQTSVSTYTVPGGVIALVEQPNCDLADLIIIGTRARSYPIDERIVYPILDAAGIKDLSYVFMLACDFDAIDDYLRIASSHQADTIFVLRSLAPAVSDVLRSQFTNDTLQSRVKSFSVGENRLKSPGYAMTDCGLCLNLSERQILFCREISQAHFQPLEGIQSAVVVSGQRWQPTIEEMGKLARIGYDRVICSKVEQLNPELFDEGEGGADRALPEFIHDLSTNGPLTLRLD